MRTAARLLLACLGALALAAPAHAARADGPTGLHAFLLRSDEPRATAFARTPAFAWSPVAGALRYEFQLSTSSIFRESGIVYEDEAVTGPAASPPLALPWVTGNPHSLFARVRAVLPSGVTPWSSAYGFDMRARTLPTPIETYPGLLRWTPVEGATGYTVWYLFPDGTETKVNVLTNVVDQREWYTLHQGSSFSGKVKWRIRAFRRIHGTRANGLPATSYGPWSPIYSTTNPAFTTGPLKALATASDTVGTAASPDTHRLAPAFLFSGNTSLFKQTAELYRVHVFTDRDCINRVFSSPAIGSPAYAPRPFGPAGASPSRTAFVPGARVNAATFDGDAITPNEELGPFPPFTGGKAPEPAAGTSAAPTAPALGPTDLGAPADFWDIDFDRGARYYWTVVPVGPSSAGGAGLLGAPAASGDKSITVAGGVFAVGDALTIGAAPSQDKATVVSVSGTTLGLSNALTFAHGPGEVVARTSSSTGSYRELELAQEACAAGRVATFGRTSEPVVTAAAAPYASGLSTKGRLVAASSRRVTFYGSPLVAWSPALSAGAYEVQWSRTSYPFRPAAAPLLTFSTSAVLPLRPGTWYYRVRGINFSLPTKAQPMSWSDPVELRIARPTFRVVGR